MKNQSIKNYATLFLSWMPFRKISFFERLYFDRTAETLFILINRNSSQTSNIDKVLPRILELSCIHDTLKMVTLKICNFNLLDVPIIEEITMTRQQLKNEKQQAEPNLCLKGFHILKFINNKY